MIAYQNEGWDIMTHVVHAHNNLLIEKGRSITLICNAAGNYRSISIAIAVAIASYGCDTIYPTLARKPLPFLV